MVWLPQNESQQFSPSTDLREVVSFAMQVPEHWSTESSSSFVCDSFAAAHGLRLSDTPISPQPYSLRPVPFMKDSTPLRHAPANFPTFFVKLALPFAVPSRRGSTALSATQAVVRHGHRPSRIRSNRPCRSRVLAEGRSPVQLSCL
jgi:hypothetical protein